MAYKVINEALGLYSCRLGDITMKQAECFLKQWNSQSSLDTLTLFVDEENRIVLNEDNEYYTTYLSFTQRYLYMNEEQRSKFREIAESTSLKEAAIILEAAIKKRYIAAELKILDKHLYDCQFASSRMMEAIIEKYGKNGFRWCACFFYMYGKIQGKREERARRKKIA